VGGEPDIVRGRHHHVRDHPRFQAAHPVREYRLRHPIQLLEALRQQAERRRGFLVVGEPDKPEPGPGQHCAEHVHPGLHTPVDDQRLTWCPHPRPAAAVLATAPLRLRLGYQPAEVPGRAGIPGRLRLRQQPLRRNPPQRLLHPQHHQVPHLVKVPTPGLPGQALTGLVRLNDPAHRLVRRAADLRGTSIAAHIPIGGDHIHPIPRVLHNGDPFRGSSDWLTPSPSTAEGPQRLPHDERGVGDFHWPPAGTATWPPVGTFSWPWTLRRLYAGVFR
jgi:hypothetical protein